MAGGQSSANIATNTKSSQYITGQYRNMVGLQDLADETFGYGTSSMDGSVFAGGAYGMNSMGMMGGMGPGSERMNMSEIDLMRYDAKINSLKLDEQANAKKKFATVNFKSNAPEYVISQKIGILKDVIKDNDQDEVIDKYNALKTAIKKKFITAGYTGFTDEQINAYAEKIYYDKTGNRIIDDLNHHGDSEFVQGLKEGSLVGLGWLFTNKINVKDNIATITDKKVNKGDKVSRITGEVISAVGSFALALLAIPLLVKGGAKGLKGYMKLLKI